MKPEPKESYTEAARAIYARILAAGLALGLQARRAAELQFALDNGKLDSYLNPEFECAGSNCTLNVDSSHGSNWHAEPPKNAAGDEFYEVEFGFGVNWPCHGTTDPATCLARVAFYGRVAMLAAELHAEFGGRKYFKAGRTATQIAEQATKAAAVKLAAAVKAVVEGNCKGMRIGGSVAVLWAACEGIPAGTHRCEIGGRFYRLEVGTNADRNPTLTRDETAPDAPAEVR